MVGDDDIVKILDMGLARVELPVADGLGKTQSNLTSAGVIMGTLAYVSPEQAMDSRKVDHRTDIYSLGCTLHYFLVGKPLYSGETPMEILVAHRERPIPSLRDARPDVPEQLDAVFQKMVAKAVDDRFQSMDEVITALQACLQQDSEFIMDAELVDEPVMVVEESKSEFASQISDAVSKTVSGVVSGIVAGVVSGVKTPANYSPAQPLHAPILDQHKPTSGRSSSALEWIPSWKRSAFVTIGRMTGAVLGILAGISIGGVFGGFGIVVGILVYLWFGWQWGGGYARMFAYQNGWTHIPPEVRSGNLFQIKKLKVHAIAILIGATAGTGTVGVIGGIFLALTVLALINRSRG